MCYREQKTGSVTIQRRSQNVAQSRARIGHAMALDSRFAVRDPGRFALQANGWLLLCTSALPGGGAIDYFADSYRRARQSFLAAAGLANAKVTPGPMPDLRGVEDEALSVDVAELGAANAPHLANIIAGIHGAEGYAASAILRRWFDDHPGLLSAIRLVLVHGVNP